MSSLLKEKYPWASEKPNLVPLSKQRFQSGYFSSQLTDEFDVSVLINGRLVDDIFGSICIAKST